ncbi:hypothetical protein CA14_006292 [Aspergillus flavus]|nr:hypothetical protein CA14_006292 [Aspergillus flavus]
MASIANFVVFTRRSSDPSLGWEDNPPNTPVYTYVASAINIALSILESPHGRHYLTQLALIIDHEMDENSHFQGNKDIAKHWVDVFLAKVRAQFPVVIVDFTMNNPNELGCHPRGGWMGHLKDFDPRSHMICINGQRTADMVASACGQDGQNFRNFQFLFATMFTHEVGAHLLVTFLRNGRVNTPPTITVQGYGSRTVGESGRFLEAYLFGGTTEYYRAASQDMHQTGIPYQIDHQNRAWRISSTTINEICRYE